MSDELFALLTEHRHDNLQLFKDWSRERMRRRREAEVESGRIRTLTER